MSKEIIEKMKENDKLFKEKMNTLNEKKIKVVKPNSRSQERERHAHSRTHTHTHAHTNSSKNQKLSVKRELDSITLKTNISLISNAK